MKCREAEGGFTLCHYGIACPEWTYKRALLCFKEEKKAICY